MPRVLLLVVQWYLGFSNLGFWNCGSRTDFPELTIKTISGPGISASADFRAFTISVYISESGTGISEHINVGRDENMSRKSRPKS